MEREPFVAASPSSMVVRKATAQISFLDEVGGTSEGHDEVTVLRWRATAPDTRLDGNVAPVTHEQGGSETRLAAGPQLIAPTAVSQADVFEDPFGDRQAVASPAELPRASQPETDGGWRPQRSGAPDAMATEPPRLAPPLDTRSADTPSLESRSEDSSSDQRATITSEREVYPEPRIIRMEQGYRSSTPLPARSQPSAPPKIYDQKACADQAANCDTLRAKLRAKSIREISLDISPEFNPTPDESQAAVQERSRGYLSESRTWRGATGEVLAVGSLQGIENGHLLVKTASGEIERLAYGALSDQDLCYFAAWWGIPAECTLGHDVFMDRQFAPATMTWKASSLCHKPLYFEEVQLERYGHTTGPLTQPFVSGAHFFLNIAALPYRMGINPPNECQYPLGYYRPGSCAPWLVPPIPLSLRGGLAEAGAWVGGIYLFP